MLTLNTTWSAVKSRLCFPEKIGPLPAKGFGHIAPIDVFVLHADADNIGQLVIRPDAAIPARQDVSLGMHFPADNFANEILSLTRSNDRSIARCTGSGLACAKTVANEAKEAGIGFFPGREVSVRKCRSAGSIKKQTVPAKPDMAADKSIPDRFHHPPRAEIRFGSHVLPFSDQEKLVLLEGVEFAARGAPVSDKASFSANHEVAKLKIEPSLPATNRFGVGLFRLARRLSRRIARSDPRRSHACRPRSE
jgi:hypothetical protein